ncbi:hypothetical protein Tco_0174603 [Tanacetum coccineum]
MNCGVQRLVGGHATEEKENTDCLSGLSKVLWAEDTTMSTYLVTRSPSSAIGFKTPIDMLGFFGWLASIKQGMLEPVKVKCIYPGIYRLKGTGSMQVLQGDEVWRWNIVDGNTFRWKPHGNVDHVVGSHEVQTQDLIYYHPTRDREQHSVWELFSLEKTVISKWKAGLKDDMDARSDVCMFSATVARKCSKLSATALAYYWGGLHQSRFYNEKLVQTLLKGHSTLSLEDSLSGDCDVEKNGGLSGMLVKFERGLTAGTYRFLLDFDYAMGSSIKAAYMYNLTLGLGDRKNLAKGTFGRVRIYGYV